MFGFHSIALVLVLVAFVFTLLALISGPVAPTLKLAEIKDTTFGIFGYVYKGATSTAKVQGYPVTFSEAPDWAGDGPISNVDSLAKLFVVAPIACGLNFLSVLGYGFGHISRGFRVVAFVLNLLAMAALIVICIMVVLVFHPHVLVIGWLTVAAAGCALLAAILGLVSIFVGSSDATDGDTDSEFSHDNTTTKFDEKFGHVQTNTISLPETRGYDFQQKPPASQNGAIGVPVNREPLNPDLIGLGPGHIPFIHHQDGLVVGLVASHPVIAHMAPKMTPTLAPTQNPYAGGMPPYPELRYSDEYEHANDANGYQLDLGSEFTLVSQRPPNPNYEQPPPPPPPHGQYGQALPYAPLASHQAAFQQQPFQQQPVPQGSQYNGPVGAQFSQGRPRGYAPQHQPPVRSTVQDSVLSQNPDFNVAGAGARRRQAPGFVPVARRYNGANGRPVGPY